MLGNLKRLSRKGKDKEETEPLLKIFGDKLQDARNISIFLKNVVDLEKEAYNPMFVKYLIEKQDFKTQRTVNINNDNSILDYRVEYYGEPYIYGDGERVPPHKVFRTENVEINNDDIINEIVKDIRYHYDTWRKIELNKILKRSGIATTIGLTIILLVTGLSLGLKRSGSDAVRDAKYKQRKAEKLTPA